MKKLNRPQSPQLRLLVNQRPRPRTRADVSPARSDDDMWRQLEVLTAAIVDHERDIVQLRDMNLRLLRLLKVRGDLS